MLFFIVPIAFAEEMVIKGGVSLDKIPKDFYGNWRVSAKLTSTNADGVFKEKTVDLWNLSRLGDVITLDNPFSGAKASITVSTIEGRTIKFRKTGEYDGKRLSDTVQLILGKDTFKGINNLRLETKSEIDSHVIKTEWAVYSLTGEKISGDEISK